MSTMESHVMVVALSQFMDLATSALFALTLICVLLVRAKVSMIPRTPC